MIGGNKERLYVPGIERERERERERTKQPTYLWYTTGEINNNSSGKLPGRRGNKRRFSIETPNFHSPKASTETPPRALALAESSLPSNSTNIRAEESFHFLISLSLSHFLGYQSKSFGPVLLPRVLNCFPHHPSTTVALPMLSDPTRSAVTCHQLVVDHRFQ